MGIVRKTEYSKGFRKGLGNDEIRKMRRKGSYGI